MKPVDYSCNIGTTVFNDKHPFTYLNEFCGKNFVSSYIHECVTAVFCTKIHNMY